MYILLLIILLLVIIFIVLFNRLIRYKNLMREAWSGIDVQLKMNKGDVKGTVLFNFNK